ncbi:MAG: metal-dependent transcriptional regulator [Flexilinea sp.]|nr:metal-dependent transcriptional regulator [Flexilinea sp.]
MELHESGEMYLETILLLSKKSPYVRAIDISAHMGFSKPSVSRGLGLLKKGGYITVDPGGAVELTESGRAIAEAVWERHTTLTEALMRLGVDEQTASEDACRMEHYISERSFRAVRDWLERANEE